MSSKLLFGRRWATLCFWLVKKLSRQMMSWPWATRRSQRWEPRKPAPPVTRIRFREVDVGMGDCQLLVVRCQLSVVRIAIGFRVRGSGFRKYSEESQATQQTSYA